LLCVHLAWCALPAAVAYVDVGPVTTELGCQLVAGLVKKGFNSSKAVTRTLSTDLCLSLVESLEKTDAVIPSLIPAFAAK
jgi:hypothetical protein